jgi:glycosyltransferase involved in cell wall biosynthesis
MNRLTVIIPFLNEGTEIERTVASIRETAGDEVDILLVNDNSQDKTDYDAVAEKYNARYTCNSERQGVARSRDIGIEMCETPYFVLFDGHMRFYHNNWWKAATEALADNDHAIYCLRCFPLNEQFELMENQSMGAYINMFDTVGDDILNVGWSYYDDNPGEPAMKIPCLLGACYAASKRYWNYIRGLTGLRTYGCDEAYLSLKTWLEGGACLLLKEIKVGHIFREKAPYAMSTPDLIYNKLFMAETMFPVNYKTIVFRELHKSNPDECAEAMNLLVANKKQVAEMKLYYKQIFTCEIDSFINFNQHMRR